MSFHVSFDFSVLYNTRAKSYAFLSMTLPSATSRFADRGNAQDLTDSGHDVRSEKSGGISEKSIIRSMKL